MNTFDQAARYAARNLDAAGFLVWLFRVAAALWRWSGWVDTQQVAFPGEPDRRCDTVARFERRRGDQPPVAAVVEFMTRPSADIYPRLAEYALRVHREVPFHKRPRVAYRVVTALVHLTGPAPNPDWSLEANDFGDLGLWIKCRALTFADVEAGALFAEIESGATSRALLAWGPLLKGADDPAVVAEWKRLALREPDQRRRRDYGGLAKVFSRLAKREEVWSPYLEGMNVEESSVLREWADSGAVKALREKVMLVLRDRFPGAVPSDLESALNRQRDAAVMSQWFDQAFRAKTLDEVRSAFGLSGAAAKKTPKRRH
jgi:hypothetical protein